MPSGPMKCDDCGARWYRVGIGDGCLDCGSENVSKDTGIPVCTDLRKAVDEDGPHSELMLEAAETIEWFTCALPVLKTMCRKAGLIAGADKAQEMLDSLARRET